LAALVQARTLSMPDSSLLVIDPQQALRHIDGPGNPLIAMPTVVMQNPHR
jgi:hypothetical protein